MVILTVGMGRSIIKLSISSTVMDMDMDMGTGMGTGTGKATVTAIVNFSASNDAAAQHA